MRCALLLMLIAWAPACSWAESGSELVRRYFDIAVSTELSAEAVREAVLRIVPVGTEIEQVVEKLSARGLSHPNWPNNPSGSQNCFPDRTPIVCQFRSPKQSRYEGEPNWSIEFFFDINNKLEDVEVRQWRSGRKGK